MVKKIFFYHLVFIMCSYFTLMAEEKMVVLKSGRVVSGDIRTDGDDIWVITKYGKIKYHKSDITIKDKEANSNVKDVSDSSDQIKEEDLFASSNTLLMTKSGRVYAGNLLEKKGDFYLAAFGGIIKINQHIIADQVDLEKEKVKGDVISGEMCQVTLKSGRSFSGIVDERNGEIFVASRLGVVKIEEKELADIKRTGTVLDLREKPKEDHNIAKSDKPKTDVAMKPTGSTQNKITMKDDDLSYEGSQKSAQEAVGKSKEKTKMLHTVYEYY